MKPYCVNIEITEKCNYNCIHCFAGKIEEAQEISMYRFKVIFDKLNNWKIFYYNLTGGEPTLHKNWREMIDYMNEKRVCYSINTNGSILTEDDIKYLKKKRINHVKLSLDGPKKIHNEIRQNKEAFDNVLNCTKLLQKYQIPFAFQMTLMEKNCQHIAETCEIAKDVGGMGIRINFYKDFNNLNQPPIKSLRGEVFRETIFQIERLIQENKKNLDFKINFENSLAVLYRKRSCCGAAVGKFQVDTNCNVTPCRYLPINMGNLYNDELSVIFNHPIVEELKTFPARIKEGCSNCAANNICGGGCPAFIYNEYRNLSKKDPRCWEN